MEFIFILIALLLVILVWDYFNSLRRDRMMERLGFGFDIEEDPVDSVWDGAADLLQLEALRDLLFKSAIIKSLDLMIKRTLLNITLMQTITLFFAVTLISSLFAYLYFKTILAILIAILLAPLILWAYFKFLAGLQQKKLDAQISPLINSLLTTMRAGGTPIQALQAISKNATNPLRDSITQVMNQLQIGHSANSVWKEWADFWGIKSANLLATGIRVKWETGGQMTGVLEHILETIESDKRLYQRINTLTTQAKLGSWVLAAIPPLLAYMQYKVDASLVLGMLEDEVGKKLYIYAGISTMVGFFWLRKLAKVKAN